MNREKLAYFELWNATLETIYKILACLDASKVPGLEGISSECLNDGAEVLALPLCNLVNLSIKQFLFSNQCKITNLPI